MSWYCVDDKSAFHAKVVAAGNAAWGALTRMGAWSSDHLTDGAIPQSLARVIATKEEIENLFSTGLLENFDASTWQIHDFLDWNLSASEVKRRRKDKAKAGRASASKRWSIPVTDVTTRAVTESKQIDAPIPIPIPIPRERERAREELGYTHEPGASLMTVPPKLALDDAYRGVAAENMLTDVATVFAGFKAHHESKLTMSANWLAEWRKWCAREKNIQARDRQRSREGPSRFEPKPQSPGGMSPRVRKPQEPAAPRELAASLGRALVDNLGGSPVEVVRTHTATDVEPRTSESHGGNGSPLPPVDTTSRRTEAPESVPTFDLTDSDPAPDFDQDDPSEDWLAASGDT